MMPHADNYFQVCYPLARKLNQYAEQSGMWWRRAAEKGTRRLQQREDPMQLVERHVIRKRDPRFAAIDRAAFAS